MNKEAKHKTYQFALVEHIQPSVWKIMEDGEDGSVFFTHEWDSYLTKMGKRRIIVSVSFEGTLKGYFLGSRFWIGINIIMAPSMGTGTYTQGLCMIEPTSEQERIIIYKQLATWFFQNKLASYIQIRDLQIREESEEWNPEWHHKLLEQEDIHHTPRYTFLLDVRPTEEELWKRCHQSIRRYVNRGQKEGLTIKIVTKEEEIEPFVDQHDTHMKDMLRRHKTSGLPSQRRKSLSALCHALFPNHVVMFEVVGKDENGKDISLSSCIFAYGKAGSTFFTGASYHEYMNRHPNEMMMWEAMRLVHERGGGVINLGGTADYKKKLGPVYAMIPIMTFSKYNTLHNMYRTFKKGYAKLLSIKGHLK